MVLDFKRTSRLDCFLENNSWKCQVTDLETRKQHWINDVKDINLFGCKVHTLRGISSEPKELFIMFEDEADCWFDGKDILCSERKELIS